jgi:hypothetical protein
MRMRSGATHIVVDDAWHDQLPANVRRAVAVLTWPLLRRYGYVGGHRTAPSQVRAA